MSDVGISIVTPAEAHALRLEAQLVLRSVRRRKVCECDRPFRDGNTCVWCGKWLKPLSSERRLLAYIDAMDEIQSEPQAA